MQDYKDISKKDTYLATFSDPFPNTVEGECALWKAVITQALMDAGSNSFKTEAIQEKRRAIQWLLSGDDDFITVCLHANLDPEYVREKARIAIKRGCVWRAAPSAKKSAPAPVLPLRDTTKKVGLPFPLRHKSQRPARIETTYPIPLRAEPRVSAHTFN